MGTSFYWARSADNPLLLVTGETVEDGADSDDPRIHIGKRSAAGQYCWDCSLTLCKGGESEIHMGRSEWYDHCPNCGNTPIQGEHRAAYVELGFEQSGTKRPTGVSSTASFSWAQDPERVGAICEQRPDEPLIVDEYGRPFTGREFRDMLLANCGVQFTNWIGDAFS